MIKLNSTDRLKRLIENSVKEFLANDPSEEEIEKFISIESCLLTSEVWTKL